jgi:hypothetical protein
MTVYKKGEFPKINHNGGKAGLDMTSARSYQLVEHMEKIIRYLPEGSLDKENQIAWIEELQRR